MNAPPASEREGSGRVRFGGAVLRATDLAPGTSVADGAYEISGVLGRGGMATVYGAVRRADGREVALKILDKKAAARGDVEARLRNERTLAAAVGEHPSLVAAIDGGRLPECDDAPFVVTERIHGPELSYLIATERRLEPLRAAKLALDIADGLEALHAHGIVHRDVKPDNVLVVVDGGGREQAKLIDFGIAVRSGGGPGDQPRVTVAGERPGTPLYMCPEQSLGAPAAPEFDVYALGVMLYEMLAGVTPFAGVADPDLLDDKLHRHASIDVAAVREGLPSLLPELVHRCLQPLPSQRATLAELQQGLCVILGVRRADPERHVDVTELGPRAGVLELQPAGPTRAERLIEIHRVEQEPAMEAAPREAAAVPRSRRRWVIAILVLVALLLFAWWRLREDGAERAEPSRDAPPQERKDEATIVDPSVTPPVRAEDPDPPAAPQIVPAEPVSPVLPPVELGKPDPEIKRAPPSKPDKPSPTPTPKPEPKDGPTPAEVAQACERTRDAAQAAMDAFDWTEVLAATTGKQCWEGSATRTRMRVRAFANLGRWEDCVEAAGTSSDAQVVRQAQGCKKQMESE